MKPFSLCSPLVITIRLIFLLSVMLSIAPISNAASFGCYGNLSVQEKMICESPSLSSLDFKLDRIYSLAYAVSDPKLSLKQSQRQWLSRSRSLCKDDDCLRLTYENRISELLTLIQSQSDPLPQKIEGSDVHREKVQTPYCKLNDEPHYMDTFDITVSIAEKALKGRVDGIYDCGRKIWEADLSGRVEGNIAFVEFDTGFFEPQIIQAIVCVSRGKLHWRTIVERRVESYIPESRSIQLKR